MPRECRGGRAGGSQTDAGEGVRGAAPWQSALPTALCPEPVFVGHFDLPWGEEQTLYIEAESSKSLERILKTIDFFSKAARKQPSEHARSISCLHWLLPTQLFIGLSSTPLLTMNDFLPGNITRTVVAARILWQETPL